MWGKERPRDDFTIDRLDLTIDLSDSELNIHDMDLPEYSFMIDEYDLGNTVPVMDDDVCISTL